MTVAADFAGACNAAQPSPSGRYIAVLVDGLFSFVVLRKDQGYRFKIQATHSENGYSFSTEPLTLCLGLGPQLKSIPRETGPRWAAPISKREVVMGDFPPCFLALCNPDKSVK